MDPLILYLFFLFFGLPLAVFAMNIATLSDDAKQDLTEAAKNLNGRIYTARINCKRSRNDHFVGVHGRSPDDARRKIQTLVRQCDVEILETASEPIWQKALRSVF